MNISRPFIRRPVMTTILMLALLVFGIMAFRLLPVSELPNVDFPTIMVFAVLPGASPATMASSVATPLEKQFSTIAGLDSMSSTNTLGTTRITLQFSLQRSLDSAAQDVQSAISNVMSQLPTDMPAPPSYFKLNPAASPILFIALTSPTLPLSSLNEYGETVMAQSISMVNGVAQVQVYGEQKYAVRIQLNPDSLATLGIGIDQVAAAVQNQNVDLPTGTLSGKTEAFTIDARGQLFNARGFGDIIVAYRKGSPVRLSQLGNIINSVQDDKVASWFYTKQGRERSIVLAVQRQPGTNTVAVATAVKKLLPTFRDRLPSSVDFKVLIDRSETIRQSVADVEFTLLLAVVLVILVIFFFLRTLSATLIPSLALPFSLLGTFAVMYLLHFSLDNLSLMALTLAIGFLVDDAIVMLENIFRHQELGEGVMEATLKGSQEISFTIIAMTLSLAAVFIPILFMGGIIGRLFREFGVTIAVAVLFSGFISLTLTPMASSKLLKPRKKEHGRMYLVIERFLGNVLGFYKSSLLWALRHRRPAMVFSLIVLVVMVFLFIKIPKGFIPSEDSGQFSVITEAREGISFSSMVEHQKAVAERLISYPDIESLITIVGGFTGGNSGRMFVTLVPRSKRKLSVDQTIAKLRIEMASIPGISVFMQNPPPIQVGGRFTKSLYQFTLQGPDTDSLYRYASLLERRMREMQGLVDVTSDVQLDNPQLTIDIDRAKAASMGISARQVEEALSYGYGQRTVSTILAPNNEYDVLMELEPPYQRDPAQLAKLYVRSSDNELVPLNSVTSLSRTLGPFSINHTGQFPSATISFNLAPGVSIGNAIKEIGNLASENLPSGISTSFQGTAQAFQSSFKGLFLLLVMTILVIYMILGILYESFIHPLTILSALPFAGFGALITLIIFRAELDLYAFVGIIMLVGLVKKNGIIMIDFALAAEKNEGKKAFDSIFEACVVRFRPIMMTTMAILVGTLPIALGIGAGGEARRPLGLAVVGGLLFSQMITLYVTPIIYTYMDQFRSRWRKGNQAE
jgi:HAE1 family hydrophobic/amphiphilic exporter-1